MNNADVDAIMKTIPERWRGRWCGGENGACACMGCVQIGNRLSMYEAATGVKFQGDPEYIREANVPKELYDRLKISKTEWEAWKVREVL